MEQDINFVNCFSVLCVPLFNILSCYDLPSVEDQSDIIFRKTLTETSWNTRKVLTENLLTELIM